MKDLSYLKDFPIAILGAGAVGKTVGADCKLAGQKVHICDLPPFAESTLKALDKTGLTIEGMQVNRYNFYRGGRAFYDVITDDVAACVKGCKIICVCTPSVGHKAFFEKLIPALEDGMIIHIIPDNFGSLLLRKMMREAGCTKKVIIGGWSSAPYGTRFVTEGGLPIPKVAPIYRAITLRGASGSQQYMPMALDLLNRGKIHLMPLLTQEVDFADVRTVMDAYRACAAQRIKMLVRIGGENVGDTL